MVAVVQKMKQTIIITALIILVMPVAVALCIDIDDTYSYDGTTGSDEIAFVNYDFDSEACDIDYTDPDMVCFNWDYFGGTNDGPELEGFDNCYSTTVQNRNDCVNCWDIPYEMNTSHPDWVGFLNYIDDEINDRVCDGCDFDTSSRFMDYQTARLYYNCDDCPNSVINDTEFDASTERYYAVYPRQYYCASDGDETFTLRGRYYDRNTTETDWVTMLTKNCTILHNEYYGCDTDDDEVSDNTGTTSLTDPCDIKDGSTANHTCTQNSDCVSDNCGGVGTSYDPLCEVDGYIWFNITAYTKNNTCGGTGYTLNSTLNVTNCTTEVGTGYVCDSDLDQTNTNDPADFCKRDVHETCSLNSDCWDDNGGYDCWDGTCEFTGYCGDTVCNHLNETPVSCPSDCCTTECRNKWDDPGPEDFYTCYASCNYYNGCLFYNYNARTACDGQDIDAVVCSDYNSYVTCCEGTVIDCDAGEVCNNGQCIVANYTDLEIIDVIPIQVIPDVDMVLDKSGYVRVIVRNNGPLDANATVNVTFEGNPLTPYQPANATIHINADTNATFDFHFKPNISGNQKTITANVSVI